MQLRKDTKKTLDGAPDTKKRKSGAQLSSWHIDAWDPPPLWEDCPPNVESIKRKPPQALNLWTRWVGERRVADNRKVLVWFPRYVTFMASGAIPGCHGVEQQQVPLYMAGEMQGDVVLFHPDAAHTGGFEDGRPLPPFSEEEQWVSVDHSFVLHPQLQEAINRDYFEKLSKRFVFLNIKCSNLV